MKDNNSGQQPVDNNIVNHMRNVKLLTALYSGKKFFVECYPTDEGAIHFPNSNRAVKEIELPDFKLYEEEKFGYKWVPASQFSKHQVTPETERNKTDANIYIDRAIEMMKDVFRSQELVAGYNGIVSLLRYAKESHSAHQFREGQQSAGVYRKTLEKVKENLAGWEDSDTMMGIAIKNIDKALSSPVPSKEQGEQDLYVTEESLNIGNETANKIFADADKEFQKEPTFDTLRIEQAKRRLELERENKELKLSYKSLSDQCVLLAGKIIDRDRDIERLRGLIRFAHDTGLVAGFADYAKGGLLQTEQHWNKFKSENNL